MIKDFLPCCFFPTLLPIVDDEQSFLDGFRLLYVEDRLMMLTFTDPQVAVQALLNQYSPNHFMQHVIGVKETEYAESNTIGSAITLLDIHQHIYDANRFNMAALVIVDFDMPAMNGLEFSKKIACLKTRRLLLTGKATQTAIIQAFKDELIDDYIAKGTMNQMKNDLSRSIARAQWRFFCEASKGVMDMLLANKPSSCLKDPAFIKLFKAIFNDKQYGFSEYYLVNASGDYLFLTFEGKPYWLVVASDTEMEEYISEAKGDQAPPEIIQPLIERTKVPFFFNVDQRDLDASQWGPLIHEASRLEGQDECYYYALIPDNPHYPLEKRKILSHQAFLTKFYAG